jgi:histidinol-phosphate aminotransferase
MQPKLRFTRRNFMVAAALGAAGARIRPASAAAATRGDYFREESPILRLSRNESPYGLSPSARDAINGLADSKANRYPIDEPAALVETIARKFDVAKELVALGCGSIEVLKMATETFCSPSRPAVVAEPTYEAVVTYCGLIHARAIKTPLTEEYTHDLRRMARAAGRRAGMVFLCNPSNPAGTIVGKDEVERFVRRLPKGVVLLSDEAYFEYAEDPNYESCLRYVREGLPVIVSRTFSKIYGMAGLRVGFAIGRKDLIERIRKRRLANNPNQIATAAAIAALKGDDEFVVRVRNLNSDVRDYLCRELSGMKLEFIPSTTNFVTINLGRPAKPVIEELKKRRVHVGRLFKSIPNHMRVTLGTVDEMKMFVNELSEVLAASPA